MTTEADPREQLEREQAEFREILRRLSQFEKTLFQLEFLGPGGAPVAVPEVLQPELFDWLIRRLVAGLGLPPEAVEPPPSTEPPTVVAPTVAAPVTEEPAVEAPIVDQVGEVSAASAEPVVEDSAAAGSTEETSPVNPAE